MARLRVAACQINTVVGDLEGNVRTILDVLRQAEEAGADLAVFPELAVTGYPPEDLLLKPSFVSDNRTALGKVAAGSGRCAAVIGFVDSGRDLYNAAAVVSGGSLHGVYRKRVLPNYSVFDEARYFASGTGPGMLFVVGGVRVGLSICEDGWSPSGPVGEQAAGGAELMVNLSASPYYAGRSAERERMFATRAADASCALVFVNQVGGQDELVFDGGSMAFQSDGELVARARSFEEQVLVFDLDVRPVFRKRLLDPRGRVVADPLPEVEVSGPVDPGSRPGGEARPPIAEPLSREAEVYAALVLGTRDYVRKNGFTDVVLGLSGGVDSSLVAAIAVDALGADHVHGVLMPSRFTSDSSVSDALELAEHLRIEHRTIPIEDVHAGFLEMLGPSFEGLPEDLTEENVQARIRGTTLMALSNKFGWMVLATGNKSEMAAGFSTLYGDLAGGFAVIKDVPKTLVYELCRHRNEAAAEGSLPPIPEAVLDKAPSAELRADQRDDQSLPPYEELDPVLEAYVNRDLGPVELEEAGFDGELVRRVAALVDKAEYKRRQAPPGVRVSLKAFGKDRRLPITNRYSGWD